MCTASKKKKEKGWHLNDNQPLTIRDSLILKVLKGVECRGCLRGHGYGNSLFFIVTAHIDPYSSGSLGVAVLNHTSAHYWLGQPCQDTQHHRCFFLLELTSQSDESRGPCQIWREYTMACGFRVFPREPSTGLDTEKALSHWLFQFTKYS